MKKMKKLTAILLLGALCTSIMFTGCTQKDGQSSEGSVSSSTGEKESSEQADVPENLNMEGFPIVKEPITVKMMGYKHPIHGNWADMVFFKEMEEKTNIKFEYDTPAGDVFEEKKNLSFTSGAYPEVFFGGNLSAQQQIKYGEQGILLPLEGYIEQYCPNIQAMLEANPSWRKDITAPDGHIYSLVNTTTAPLAMLPSMWYNVEWLEALGVTYEQLPKSVEDLEKLFIRMRDEDPNGNSKKDEIPFSFSDKTGGVLLQNFLPAFGIPAQGPYVDDQGKIHFGYLEENFKPYLEWVNNLWSEGLLDKDGFAQASSDVTAKGKENLVGLAPTSIPQLVYDCLDPNDAARYPWAPALSSTVSPKQAIQRNTGIAGGVFSITDKCENIEAMMRWVDYLYSEEGSFLVHYGPENLLWEKADNGLFKYILPEDGRGTEELRGGEITPDCGVALPKWVRAETESSWDDALQQVRAEYADINWEFAVLPLPNLYFTAEEQNKIDILKTDIDKYTSENVAKFMTGEMPIAEYDGFVERLKKMGIDEYIQIHQQSYDRWASAE